MPRDEELRLTVEGLDCPSCALKVESGAKTVRGVRGASASSVTGALRVTHDGSVRAADVAQAVQALGYRVRQPEADPGTHRRTPDAGQAELLRRARLAAVSGTLLIAAFIVSSLADGPTGVTSAEAAYLASIAAGGWLVAGKAFSALRSRVVNFEVLVVIAVVGAIAIGELGEAALVVFLFAVGETLEAAGVSRTRRAISSLLDLVPRTALVRRDGVEVEVSASEIRPGDTVIIRPGERLPVDGRVTHGRSFVDQAPITGESMPVAKEPGDDVYAGTVNGSGGLEVTSTREPEDTTLARIVHLVEEAQLEKAGHQKLIDRFAASYTPVVVALAVVVAVAPPLILSRPFEPYIYRALSLLLVACPCAMVLSTPVAVVAAIGNAARNGVLIKGGSALEAAGRLRAVAFDKTGTLTLGRPEVTDVVPATAPGTFAATTPDGPAAGPLQTEDVQRVLVLAAAVEGFSEHPVASAIRKAASEREPSREVPPARNFEAIPGRGAKARVLDQNHYIGNAALFENDLGLALDDLGELGRELEREGKTVVYLGTSHRLIGLIAVSDTVRPEAAEAVLALRRAGIARVYLLTGDNEPTARAVTERLGLDGYRARLLPGDKVGAVRELRGEAGGLAMVGDGVNDAPALATADVGMAMGVAGTDQAIEAADIALMSDDLGGVAYAVSLGRRAVGIIRWNIGIAIGIKAAALALAVAGYLPLWLAVLADTGNTVLVILNGLRLLGGSRG